MKQILRIFRELDEASRELKWYQWILLNCVPPFVMIVLSAVFAIAIAMLLDHCQVYKY